MSPIGTRDGPAPNWRKVRKLVGGSAVFETRHRSKGGSLFDVEVNAASVRIGGKQLFFCVTRDITDRKKAEHALRESETRFRQLVENLNEVFWISDRTGTIPLYISPAYERIWGRSCDSLYAAPTSWREQIHPADRARMEPTFSSDPGCTQGYTYRIVRADGSIRWIRDRGFPVRDETGNIVRFAGIAEDITAMKSVEEELQRVNEELRDLSRRLFEVRDQERQHLARELHDEIGQALTVAKINVASLEAARNGERSPRISETTALLDKLLRQVRQISLDLHPSLLDDLGLAPALRSLLDQQARTGGLRAQFFVAEPMEVSDHGIQTTGFRIAQEALTNVLRHAQAQLVRVELRTEDGRLQMKIVDDGKGFDVTAMEQQAHREKWFGLMGMRERAALVGGRVSINSCRDGTTVEVSLPLNG
jgi:PAS domain S-box-containing protein